jgi:hypothetical protein
MMIHKILFPAVICIIPVFLTLVRFQEPAPSQELDSMPARELVILYSKTKMDLAQVEFDWANEQVAAGVITKPNLERQRSELAISKEQFNQAILASSGGLEKVRLCNAEEKVRLAKLNYENAKKLKAKQSLSEFGLKRYELKYKLARLNLALLKNPENYVTLIEALQAQIDQLGQETVALDLRITKLESANF